MKLKIKLKLKIKIKIKIKMKLKMNNVCWFAIPFLHRMYLASILYT